MSKLRISLLLGLIILSSALFNLSCSPKPVLTLGDAVEIVLNEVVKPEQLDHSVIVFAWPDLLTEGDLVGPYNQPETGSSKSPTEIQEDSWFIWIEDAPAAYFAHPSRFVIISKETGLVSVSDENWWPILNGEGLWTSRGEYWNPSNWVYHNLDYGSRENSSSLTKFMASAIHQFQPQIEKPGAAIVINAWKEGETQKENFGIDSDGMHDVLTDSNFDVTYLGPESDANKDQDQVLGPDNRINVFKEKSKELKPGDTLVVFVTGHGQGKESDKGGVGGHVSESWLKAILRDFDPAVHIVVIIESCFSGDFIDSVSKVADIIITSTNNDLPSYGAELGNHVLDGVDDPNPDDKGGEFSSGFIEGWRDIITDPSKLDEARRRAESSGTGIWEEVAAMSFVAALEKDAGYLNGKTLPLSTRGAAETRPTPMPATPTSTPEPPPKQSLGFLGDYKISMGVKKDSANHRGFINMPGSMTVTAKECSICIDGPFPWVNISGEISSDGSVVASGKGTVAGYPNITVTFQGSIVGNQLQGDYTMGANGGLPGGQSIIYAVSGDKKEPTPIPTLDPRVEEIQSFFNTYNEMFLAADVDGLLGMLHPEVLGLYGAAACQEYLGAVVENTIQIELLQLLSGEPWSWEIDDQATIVEDAYSVQVQVTVEEQVFQQEMHLGRNSEGNINWFTDCGVPLGSTEPENETLFIDELMSTVLDNDLEVCGAGCDYKEGPSDQSKTLVWCRNGTCPSNGGTCHLYRRELEDSPQEPGSWDYVTGPAIKMQKDLEYEYHCFCVK